MTATIGHSALLLALVLAGWGMAAPILWARTGRRAFFSSALGAILGQFGLVTVASLALIYGLVTTDFSIKYVAFNTSRATPLRAWPSGARDHRRRGRASVARQERDSFGDQPGS